MTRYWPLLLIAVLFALVVGLVGIPVTGIVLYRMGWFDPPVGTTLIYEAIVEEGRPVGASPMAPLLRAIDARLNPGLHRTAQVREIPGGRIAVGVFGDSPAQVERVRALLAPIGMLEFRILANQRDHRELIEQALLDESPVIYDAQRNPEAWWVPVVPGEEESFAGYSEIARRPSPKDPNTLEILVVADPFNVTGEYLSDARAATDLRGRPCVIFQFDRTGGYLFGGLTGNNLPDDVENFTRKLGIILDGWLHSAPAIQSTIYDRGEITGSFTVREVEDIARVLSAGALPCAIREVASGESEESRRP